MHKVVPEGKRTLELDGSVNNFMKTKKCDYCGTPNCNLPCHQEDELTSYAKSKNLIVPILSLHNTKELEKLANQSKKLGPQIAYGLATLVDKINEIIECLNKKV